MRPVDKAWYTDNDETYRPYGNAKDDLIKALGPFCNFCERQGFSSALDVEHIENKHEFPSKQYHWSNFLLGCKNCNPIKGTKSVVNVPLPHQNNTFVLFSYLESGLIMVNPAIDDGLKISAEKLIELVGLDRRPGHPNYSNKDKRWVERKRTWTLAKRYLTKFNQGRCDIETIKDLALANGFWSIWMDVFAEHEVIRRTLINSFTGTQTAYFSD